MIYHTHGEHTILLKHMIYHTHGEHANHNTIEAVV
jgi:hypothetical protein